MRRIKDILSFRNEAETAAQDLPALMMLARDIARNIAHGPHDQRKSGAGEKFWQFREYTSSDRPQDIDWRQSAKTNHVFIRQKEWQTTQKNFFWCASGPSMDYASDKIYRRKDDAAHIITLALTLLLTRGNEQVGLLGNNKTGRSENTIEKIALDLLTQRDSVAHVLPQHLAIPKHASLVMTGDFLSPLEEIEDSFQNLAVNTGQALIIQVLDPAELNLSFSGRITFQGPQAHEKETINDVAAIRPDYIAHIQNHIAGLKTLCREQGWSYVLHATDQNLSDTLSQIWAMMDKSVRRNAS